MNQSNPSRTDQQTLTTVTNNSSNANSSSSPPASNRQSKRRSKTASTASSMAAITSADIFSPNATKNVDYFSHQWDELDLKASWSVMTKHKKTLVDGIRLENASWRKWMQKRFNLRKVPPESLRWKKDEDITWLYGPFCEALRRDLMAGAGGGGAAVVAAVTRKHRRSIDGPLMTATFSVEPSSPSGHIDEQSGLGLVSFDMNSVGQTAASQLPASSFGKKSALKKSSRSLVKDFKKFSEETDRVFRRFNRLHVSDSFDSAMSDNPSSNNPSQYVDHSNSIFQMSASDSELHLEDQFLNTQERELLDYMNHGPVLDNLTPPVTTDESKSPETEFAGKKTTKLRFSSKVQVVEYERDASAKSAGTRPVFTVGSSEVQQSPQRHMVPEKNRNTERSSPIILPYYEADVEKCRLETPINQDDAIAPDFSTSATNAPITTTQQLAPQKLSPQSSKDSLQSKDKNVEDKGWMNRLFQVASDVTSFLTKLS